MTTTTTTRKATRKTTTTPKTEQTVTTDTTPKTETLADVHATLADTTDATPTTEPTTDTPADTRTDAEAWGETYAALFPNATAVTAETWEQAIDDATRAVDRAAVRRGFAIALAVSVGVEQIALADRFGISEGAVTKAKNGARLASALGTDARTRETYVDKAFAWGQHATRKAIDTMIADAAGDGATLGQAIVAALEAKNAERRANAAAGRAKRADGAKNGGQNDVRATPAPATPAAPAGPAGGVTEGSGGPTGDAAVTVVAGRLPIADAIAALAADALALADGYGSAEFTPEVRAAIVAALAPLAFVTPIAD